MLHSERQGVGLHRFVFMRHGQTQANMAQRICGSTDVPLNETGREQALQARAVLRHAPWPYVWVSPALRARETASLALPGLPQRVLPGLRERDWGALEGQPLDQLCAYTSTPQGGEPWDEFVARVDAALWEVVRAPLPVGAIPVVVAHSGVWRALRARWEGSPVGGRLANAAPMWVQPAPHGQPWTWGRYSHAAGLSMRDGAQISKE